MAQQQEAVAVYPCVRCSLFSALTVRELLNHYNIVHSSEVNFRVSCGIQECPASFTKYNSFYKHVKRNHPDVLQNNINENPRDEVIENECQTLNDTPDELDLVSDHENSSDSTSVGGNDNDDNVNDDDADDDDDDVDDSDSEMEEEIIHHDNIVENIDIQHSAASFILKIKERNKVPQVAMDSVMNCTRSLIQQILSAAKNSLSDIIPKENKIALDEVFDGVSDPFAGIETEWLQNSYIKKSFNYVEFTEVPLGTKLVRKKSGYKRVIAEKEETFIYIPILKSLQQLLSNERIASMLLREVEPCREGVFYDICDGSIFRNDDYFTSHKNALILLLYHDELEVCNPLGSKAGKHKVDMYYYTLANINPRYRSKLSAVRLLAIANANLVKEYGIDAILQPCIEDIKTLYDGVIFNVGDTQMEVFGKVFACTGDTLGQHLWGGFKEGVGVAFQKCRSCFCNFDKMQEHFLEEDFCLRTLQLYSRHCTDIENAPNDRVKNDLRTTYGINKRSMLTELPGFDVTKQLPQDIMHTLLEGCVQYELRLVLLHFIQNGVVTLNQINGSIASHDYGQSEVSDKPGPLKNSVFFGEENYKLKYSASQSRLFLRLFPFIIGSLVPSDDEYYMFAIELLEISNIIFAPVIKMDTIQYLQELIAEHLTHFRELFPDKNILPKQHYLLHIPNSIKLLGPMIRSSCFIFESAHKYFKELARKQNFKHLSMSLAKRHQFFECANFGDSKENPSSHPLFSSEKVFGMLRKADQQLLRQLREDFDRFGLLPGIDINHAYKATWVKLFGTKYTKSGYVAFNAFGDPPFPVFGKILNIWSISEFLYFELLVMNTECFNESKQAYEVTACLQDDTTFQAYDRLVDYNIFHVKTDENGRQFIPVKYDIDDLVEEYAAGISILFRK